VDRRALPHLPQSSPLGRPPRTQREAAVCDLFADVLGVTDLGPEDNFFECGGHSLMAMRLINRLRVLLDLEPPVQPIFEDGTAAAFVASVAPLLDRTRGYVVPIRPGCDKPPLFCFSSEVELAWEYCSLARHIHKDRSIYAIVLSGVRDRDSLQDAAAVAVERVLVLQPQGPFHLFGRGDASQAAHAVACLLQRDGHEVAMLATLDGSWHVRARPGFPGLIYRGDVLALSSNGSPVDGCDSANVIGTIDHRDISTDDLGKLDRARGAEVGHALNRRLMRMPALTSISAC
jgi:hypothetical protein